MYSWVKEQHHLMLTYDLRSRDGTSGFIADKVHCAKVRADFSYALENRRYYSCDK